MKKKINKKVSDYDAAYLEGYSDYQQGGDYNNTHEPGSAAWDGYESGRTDAILEEMEDYLEHMSLKINHKNLSSRNER